MTRFALAALFLTSGCVTTALPGFEDGGTSSGGSTGASTNGGTATGRVSTTGSGTSSGALESSTGSSTGGTTGGSSSSSGGSSTGYSGDAGPCKTLGSSCIDDAQCCLGSCINIATSPGSEYECQSCLAVSPTPLDFGHVGIDDAGDFGTSTKMFEVSDQCQDPAIITSMRVQYGPTDPSAQYTSPSGPLPPVAVSPGSPVSFAMTCEPTTMGDHPAQLVLSDGSGADAVVPLSCTVP